MSNETTVAPEPRLVRVYVWDRPVRVTHWLLASSIVVLAFTGFYIGHPYIIVANPQGQYFMMGTMKAVHFFAAIVFTLSELSRIAWMFLGSHYARWHQFFPVRKEQRKDLVAWIKFYSFLGPPPKFVGHNPLAGLTYVSVYILCLVAAGTGYGLFAITTGVDSPMRVFAFLVPLFGGAQTARWIHHVVMWLILIFLVHHIYCAVLITRIAKNATLDSMFSGYRFVPPEELAAETPGSEP